MLSAFVAANTAVQPIARPCKKKLALTPAPHEISETMARAVARAAAEAEPGEVVLLAPAAAGFDRYPNLERRGEDSVAQVQAVLGG